MEDLDIKELEKIIKKKRGKEKKSRFSKNIVIFVILLNVIFTSAVFYVFLQTQGSEPTVLIGSWFAFTTVELWSLAKIKREEIREEREE